MHWKWSLILVFSCIYLIHEQTKSPLKIQNKKDAERRKEKLPFIKINSKSRWKKVD